MKNLHFGITIAIILILFIGCSSSIPPKTPYLLDLTSQQIENNSVVLSQALRSVLTLNNISKNDVSEAITQLESLDQTNLSVEDKESINSVILSLKDVVNDLDWDEEFITLPDKSRENFEQSITSLKVVQQIIGYEVDKTQLIDQMIRTIEGEKNE